MILIADEIKQNKMLWHILLQGCWKTHLRMRNVSSQFRANF